MELRRTMPNLGDMSSEYAHCPNCSLMFQAVDADGRAVTIPATCRRCGCPMTDERKARAFMEDMAAAAHDPALARAGALSRGERPVGAGV